VVLRAEGECSKTVSVAECSAKFEEDVVTDADTTAACAVASLPVKTDGGDFASGRKLI